MIVAWSSKFAVGSDFSDPISYSSLPNFVSICIHCISSFCWTDCFDIPFPVFLIRLSECHLDMVNVAMLVCSRFTLPKHKISSLNCLFINLLIWVKKGFRTRTIIKFDTLFFKCIHPETRTVKASSFSTTSSSIWFSDLAFYSIKNWGNVGSFNLIFFSLAW